MFAWQVILDLEEERQRHAQDTAEGDDVTYMLEKERERLTQQVRPQRQKNIRVLLLCKATPAFIISIGKPALVFW